MLSKSGRIKNFWSIVYIIMYILMNLHPKIMEVFLFYVNKDIIFQKIVLNVKIK